MSFSFVDKLDSDWDLTSSNLSQASKVQPVKAWEFPGIARTPRYISEEEWVLPVTVKTSETVNDFRASLRRQFKSPLNLENADEIRFWLRGALVGDNRSAEHPFYLTFLASNGVPNQVWQRWLPIDQSNTWELQSLWLGDMPDSLRRSIKTIQLDIHLRSLEPEPLFYLTLGDLIATKLEPVDDVEQALSKRLTTATGLTVNNALPEAKLGKEIPCVVLTPWAVKPMRERGGSVDLIDNYVPSSEDKDSKDKDSKDKDSKDQQDGAHVRPVPWLTQLDYSIDIYSRKRSQKSQLLTAIIQDFYQQPYLRISGAPLRLMPFTPSPEETASQVSPGRTPLFYRITVPIERGERKLYSYSALGISVNSIYERQGAYVRGAKEDSEPVNVE